MTAIAQIFQYETSHVRTAMVNDSQWIVGKDICAALGISKYRDALAQLDEDERVSAAVDTPGGRQQMVLINESGLYALMLISRSPKVKPFRKWVTSEVLPAIRKTGQYGTHAALPQTFAEALQLAANQARQLEEQQQQLTAQAPAVEAWRSYLSADGDMSVADAAKALSRNPAIELGAKRLFDVLQRMGWIYRGGDTRLHPYQRCIDAGWLAELPMVKTDPGTGVKTTFTPQIRVTPKGFGLLFKRLAGGEQLALEGDASH